MTDANSTEKQEASRVSLVMGVLACPNTRGLTLQSITWLPVVAEVESGDKVSC